MNSRLLTRANTDSLTVNREAHRVRLCIFKGYKRYYKVALCRIGHILILGNYVREKRLVYLEVISSLLEGDTVNLLMLDGVGGVIRVDFNDVVASLSLALQDFKSLGLVAGSDNSVRNLPCNHFCGGNVADVGKRYPVAKGAHSVSTSCSCVSAGEGGLVKSLDVVNEASALQLIREGHAYRRRGGGNVLKRGNCGKSERLLELLDKLPGVEGVKEVNKSGTSVEYLYRKLRAVVHKNLCRLLVGVAAVFKLKFFHLQNLLIRSCLRFWCHTCPRRCLCNGRREKPYCPH